jgi:hypothetical protein
MMSGAALESLPVAIIVTQELLPTERDSMGTAGATFYIEDKDI